MVSTKLWLVMTENSLRKKCKADKVEPSDLTGFTLSLSPKHVIN